MRTDGIAIVGMACCYPDANSPIELWENVLAQRRAFRRMPKERLCLDDYFSSDRSAADCTYLSHAALIQGYEFDRQKYGVDGTTFRCSDMTHWLALDVATQAFADAGFPDGDGLPRETTSVLLGNTLTGEFSRANALRLRWPYVRRVVQAALGKEGWSPERQQTFLQGLGESYKAPFPPVGEETLAGSLSNTIAGRICNHFDLNGGGYSVDGACASSLLAISTACSDLNSHDVDVALAGGVDLSLDPFELVGFAKTGALATDEMRIFDNQSAGFWPGEGCGLIVLMRHEDAIQQQRHIYAVIRGWGVSSDGSGGLTRPEKDGQILALRRAYHRAGFGPETIALFEGHGTGTEVGDATELQVLTQVLRKANTKTRPAAIGSVKANIGHTKAAAGVAGVIKATMALATQYLPPSTGCIDPHSLISGSPLSVPPMLRVLSAPEMWPSDLPLRAAVSAMGFGGINAHIALEAHDIEHCRKNAFQQLRLLSTSNDAELFFFGAQTTTDLIEQVDHLLAFAGRLSMAELGDLAAELGRNLRSKIIRAAVVASTPDELETSLDILRSWLKVGVLTKLNVETGIFLWSGTKVPRIGFVFPGQGSPAHLAGGIFRRRFEDIRQLYEKANLPSRGSGIATEVAQPAIVTASVAALRLMNRFGIVGCLGVGHSLGELTALHWAGVMDEDSLLRIANARGTAMANLNCSDGCMASIGAGSEEVKELINGAAVVTAAFNSPKQTVVSGQSAAVQAIVTLAQSKGYRCVNLPVSHAFHSSLVADAIPAFSGHLSCEKLDRPRGSVISTVTGTILTPDEDLRRLLLRQITFPVRFVEAMRIAAQQTDLFLELGPGQVLSGLSREFLDRPVIPVDAGGPSLNGLWRAVGASYALGISIRHTEVFTGRFTRPFDLNWRPSFFVNPCELAPRAEQLSAPQQVLHSGPPNDGYAAESSTPLEVVRELVAARVELPISTIRPTMHLLKDLHLNSISIGQLVSAAARRLGIHAPTSPTEFANATIMGIACALDDHRRLNPGAKETSSTVIDPPGLDSWIQPFMVQYHEQPLRNTGTTTTERQSSHNRNIARWMVIADDDDVIADELRRALKDRTAGSGAIVCLPEDPNDRHIRLLLEGKRRILGMEQEACFVLVQRGGGSASFARTLYLEHPEITTCVIDVPASGKHVTDWILDEIRGARGFTEVHYDLTGRRTVPLLHHIKMNDPKLKELKNVLGPTDVLLVTSGGKGIAAECAFALARETGVRLALFGRSAPHSDNELTSNLSRFNAHGVKLQYISVDVNDQGAIQHAVRAIETALGPITGFLHGAGTNVPQLIESLDEAAFLRTMGPKLHGARNVLAAIKPERLRVFIAFGSLIAKTGFRGEADYAVANEMLALFVERFSRERRACKCLAIEWSVWSGVGMGERLGRIDSLVQQGITPISPDKGIAALMSLLATPLPTVSVAVSGRLGELPTIRLNKSDLPLVRFLQRPRVYYPGIELIVEADLSCDTDPYLHDHQFGGEYLFPAVMGLEAMSQVAMALAQTEMHPIFEQAEFTRPITVPNHGPTTIRILALMRSDGAIEVAIRSSETSFQVNHFETRCRFTEENKTPCQSLYSTEPPVHCSCDVSIDTPRIRWMAPSGKPLSLDPSKDLYGRLLFQGERFQRLLRYWKLRAKECVAEVSASNSAPWFSQYLSQTMRLGDAGSRDAAIHAIQSCIPHAVVLPAGIERLEILSTGQSGSRLVHAAERSQDKDGFMFDIEITTPVGVTLEKWTGLHLKRVDSDSSRDSYPIALLGPYLERRINEITDAKDLTITLAEDAMAIDELDGLQVDACEPDATQCANQLKTNTLGQRRRLTDRVIRDIIPPLCTIVRRPDGSPELIGTSSNAVSATHAKGLTLAVSGYGQVACDMEIVVGRPIALWRDLLGAERFSLAQVISQETKEEFTISATRVWCASECLQKVGALVGSPLTLYQQTPDRWTLMQSGKYLVLTSGLNNRLLSENLVVAILLECHAQSI